MITFANSWIGEFKLTRIIFKGGIAGTTCWKQDREYLINILQLLPFLLQYFLFYSTYRLSFIYRRAHDASRHPLSYSAVSLYASHQVEPTSTSPRTRYNWRGMGVTLFLLYRDDFIEPLDYRKILWHVDPLLVGDSEISHCTAAVARQRSTSNNKGKVFYVRSVSRCYKQDNWSNELVLGQSLDGKHVSKEAEDIVWVRHQATAGKDTADWKNLVRVVVKCRVFELAIAL
jgi:hypothetical protein